MCDEWTEKDNKKFLLNKGKINRREFNKLSVTALLAGLMPQTAFAGSVLEITVDVRTPDGVVDCYFAHPAKGKYPGILMWTDIKGRRPIYEAIAKRLAEIGYAVLLVNPYYRDAKAPVVDPGARLGDPDTMERLWAISDKLTRQAVMSDATAYLHFLDNHPSVDIKRKAGTFGYCMAGELVVLTAASCPNRVGAVASFHGSRSIVCDGPESPHLLISKSSAQAFHAVAENDDKRSPETKNIIRKAYETAGLAAEIEVYENTLHGWCTPDFHGYHAVQAERAWSRMLHLFKNALA